MTHELHVSGIWFCTELTILFFSCVLTDTRLSRWEGGGALDWDWDQPVGLWLGELPALGTQRG